MRTVKLWSVTFDLDDGTHDTEIHTTEAAANQSAADTVRAIADEENGVPVAGITPDNWREQLDAMQDRGCADFIWIEQHTVDLSEPKPSLTSTPDSVTLSREHVEGIAASIQAVADNWERGDLAGAVNALEGELTGLREAIGAAS